jgi:hypothetical protein
MWIKAQRAVITLGCPAAKTAPKHHRAVHPTASKQLRGDVDRGVIKLKLLARNHKSVRPFPVRIQLT